MVCLTVLFKNSVLALPGSPVDLAIPGIQSAAHEIAENTTSMPDTWRFGRQQEKPRWLVVTCCEKCLPFLYRRKAQCFINLSIGGGVVAGVTNTIILDVVEMAHTQRNVWKIGQIPKS